MGNQQSYEQARAALKASRQAHMLLVQRAVAGGFPMPELAHDEAASRGAVEHLLDLCGRQGVGAPMVLAGSVPA